MRAEKCPPDLSTSGILVTSAESVPGKVGLRSNAEAREEVDKTKCRQLFQHKEVVFRESSRVKECVWRGQICAGLETEEDTGMAKIGPRGEGTN